MTCTEEDTAGTMAECTEVCTEECRAEAIPRDHNQQPLSFLLEVRWQLKTKLFKSHTYYQLLQTNNNETYFTLNYRNSDEL